MFKRFLSFILALSIILFSFPDVAFASNKDAASTNDNIDAPGTAAIPYTAFEILESILLSFGITYTTVDLLNKSSDTDKFNNALNEEKTINIDLIGKNQLSKLSIDLPASSNSIESIKDLKGLPGKSL